MNLKNNPELIPLIEWWEKDGKSTVITVLVVALCVAGYYGIKNYRLAKRAAAAEAAASAYTTQEIEEAAANYSGDRAAPVMRLRLAKSYFDDARYDEALAKYDELAKNPPEGFADVVTVGRAQTLEALRKFEEAGKAFDAFVAANTNSYLKLTAELGSVRCLAEQGKKDAALKAVAALKDAYKDDMMSKARVENTEDLVKRFQFAPTITSKPGDAKK